MPRNNICSFEEWRSRFLADAERIDRVKNALKIPDIALRLFWEWGTEPTVYAMIREAESGI